MNSKLRLALLLPLGGVTLTWITFMAATYLDLNRSFNDPSLHLTVYLFLLGIGLFAAASSVAFSISDSMHSVDSAGAVRSVYRFNGLAVVIAMVGGAFFAIATFFSSIGSSGYNRNQVLEVYLPIILAAAMVVTVLLRATVFRKSESEPGAKADPRKRALGLAWSLPIIGTALALIIGLIAYGNRREIMTWTWVVIQVVILASIVLGTRYAVAARAATTVAAKQRVVGAGALNLNYVLSVIFGAVVLIMAFSYGSSAISKLGYCNYSPTGDCMFRPNAADAQWVFRDFLPALVLLVVAEVGIYLTITLRNRKDS